MWFQFYLQGITHDSLGKLLNFVGNYKCHVCFCFITKYKAFLTIESNIKIITRSDVLQFP